jgi:DnaK suppressor protein
VHVLELKRFEHNRQSSQARLRDAAQPFGASGACRRSPARRGESHPRRAKEAKGDPRVIDEQNERIPAPCDSIGSPRARSFLEFFQLESNMPTQPMTIMAAEIRRRKSALQSSLKRLTGFAPERQELQIELMSDPLDRMALSTTRDMAVQRMNHRTYTIHEIEVALDKIKAGDYGTCEQCGQAIAPRRLQIVPWARLCIFCQTAAEAQGERSPAFRHAA